METLENVYKKSITFQPLTEREEKIEKIIFAYGVNDWARKKCKKLNLI